MQLINNLLIIFHVKECRQFTMNGTEAGEVETTAMTKIKMWIMRRIRLRHVLVFGILLAVLLITRIWITNHDKQTASDHDKKLTYDGKNPLRRGPKIKEDSKFEAAVTESLTFSIFLSFIGSYFENKMS